MEELKSRNAGKGRRAENQEKVDHGGEHIYIYKYSYIYIFIYIYICTYTVYTYHLRSQAVSFLVS